MFLRGPYGAVKWVSLESRPFSARMGPKFATALGTGCNRTCCTSWILDVDLKKLSVRSDLEYVQRMLCLEHRSHGC